MERKLARMGFYCVIIAYTIKLLLSTLLSQAKSIGVIIKCTKQAELKTIYTIITTI